jgi:tetratricopeptide (TPR) repeat protein
MPTEPPPTEPPIEPKPDSSGTEGTPPGDDNQRNFVVDLGDGFDKAVDTIRERASHYYKKGQHTKVRLKFRGKELATIPLTMLLAVEAGTFLMGAGVVRLLLANVVGRAFLEVEFINEADNHVAAGKERLLDGELDEALTKFQEAIEIDRDHPGAHLNLGVALKLKGQRDEAGAAFEKAVALDPHGDAGKEARRQLEKLRK